MAIDAGEFEDGLGQFKFDAKYLRPRYLTPDIFGFFTGFPILETFVLVN